MPPRPLAGMSGIQRQVVATASQRAHYIDEGLVMAEIGSICVAIWRTEPTEFLFDRQLVAFRTVIEQHAEKIGFLCVVESCSPPPKESIRRATLRMFGENRKHVACVASVFEGKGFRAAISRSVLSGMIHVFGTREFPAKITDSITHAAQWMANYVDIGRLDTFATTVGLYRNLLLRP